jgi:hypothetical protein
VRIGIAAVSGLVAVGAVVWVTVQWRQGQGPADAASLIGLVIAAVGAGISVEGLRVAHAALGQPADAAAQARSAAVTLAKQVEKAEADQWRRLVGGDRDRINVRYTLCPQNYPGAATPGPGGLLFAEENAPGVPDIAFYYRATTPARLVVTGAPGAGKTVLALELLLALIEHRDETDPVPVRISLSGWNTDTSLAGYVINHLVQAYDVSRSRATQLVDHDLVLPVLDGLDEMDPGMANADGAPLLDSDGRPLPDPAAPRARAALQALNDYSRGRTAGPVVLTCRTSHYEALADDDQLADAAQIRIEPVPVDAAMTYLAQRRGHDRRWQRLLEYLRAEPTGVLAQSLSTPWRLSLAATVYRREGEPIHLTTFATAADLDDHLLARLIPAVMTLYPPRQAYSHQSVHVWLARIAHHLQQPAHAPPGPPAVGAGPRTDVHLHQLWSLAGQSLVRIADAVLAIVYVLASAGLLLAQTPLDLSARACLGAAGFAVVAVLAVLRAGSPHVAPPMVVHLRHPSTPRGKRRLARMLMAALVGGLAGGTSIGLAAGAAYGLAAGLAYAFAAALAAALSRQADSPGEDEPHAANPSRLVWQDLTIGLVTGLVAGLATGLTTGLTYGIAGGLAGGITAGLSGGLAFGLAAGLVYGLAAGLATGLATSLVTGLSTGLTLGLAGGLVGGVYLFTGAGRRYLVFLCCARSRGMLPFRTGSFLNWAYKAGLLRLSGSAYQFRHRELQQWLTTHSSPGTGL